MNFFNGAHVKKQIRSAVAAFTNAMPWSHRKAEVAHKPADTVSPTFSVARIFQAEAPERLALAHPKAPRAKRILTAVQITKRRQAKLYNRFASPNQRRALRALIAGLNPNRRPRRIMALVSAN